MDTQTKCQSLLVSLEKLGKFEADPFQGYSLLSISVLCFSCQQRFAHFELACTRVIKHRHFDLPTVVCLSSSSLLVPSNCVSHVVVRKPSPVGNIGEDILSGIYHMDHGQSVGHQLKQSQYHAQCFPDLSSE